MRHTGLGRRNASIWVTPSRLSSNSNDGGLVVEGELLEGILELIVVALLSLLLLLFLFLFLILVVGRLVLVV